MQIHFIDRNPRAVERLMAVCRDRHSKGWIPLRILCGETVGTDGAHSAICEAMLNEREGVELDRHRIAEVHEAVVASATFASTSSGASAGTRVINCCPGCRTEPTETLATVSTVAVGTQLDELLASCALFSDSRASDSLLAASASFSASSACQDFT
jgi:hypothetical protein